MQWLSTFSVTVGTEMVDLIWKTIIIINFTSKVCLNTQASSQRCRGEDHIIYIPSIPCSWKSHSRRCKWARKHKITHLRTKRKAVGNGWHKFSSWTHANVDYTFLFLLFFCYLWMILTVQSRTTILCFKLCLSSMLFLCTIHLKRLIAVKKCFCNVVISEKKWRHWP